MTCPDGWPAQWRQESATLPGLRNLLPVHSVPSTGDPLFSVWARPRCCKTLQHESPGTSRSLESCNSCIEHLLHHHLHRRSDSHSKNEKTSFYLGDHRASRSSLSEGCTPPQDHQLQWQACLQWWWILTEIKFYITYIWGYWKIKMLSCKFSIYSML